jgi:GH15 family glucan-1,4-alpha-glucosidase
MASRYRPIEDYGIIGDLHTVALVGKDGSIDFLCLPSFDSPSVFAALLDAERGGRFQIAPILDRATRKQLYLPDTNVLLTRFLHADGVAEVSVEDAGQAHNVVRRAKTVRGELRFRMRCDPRFDYARSSHTAELLSDTEISFVGRAGTGELALLTFRAGGLFEIMRWVPGWGDAAEVVKPLALRHEVARTLGAAAKPYRRRTATVSSLRKIGE